MRRILKACEGQGFADRRDTAVVRTFLARDFADAVLRLIGTVRPLLTDASRVSWEQTERVHRDLAA